MGRTTVRDLWKAKLEGRLPSGNPAWEIEGRRRPFSGVALGIDPSLRGTGVAVVEFTPNKPTLLLHSRTIRHAPRVEMPLCLAGIFSALTEVVAEFPVRHVALEQTIYVQNVQTAQILGAARGAAIAAVAMACKPVFEYPPLRVKQAVVGVGRASKEQVARTVMGMLGHGRTLALDEADAAAVAICHALTYRGDT